MNCPACGQPQVIVEHEGVELDLCLSGCGTWFDAQELGMLLGERAAALERELAARPRQGRGRRCPRCGGSMDLIAAPGGTVILDRCARGHGLWFDDGELEQVLRGAAGADAAELARVADFLSRFRAARKEA